ncbi:MAG: glycosyltransferase family 39 protein [Vampirovibrionales bacterium]
MMLSRASDSSRISLLTLVLIGLLLWGVLYWLGLGHAPLLDVDEPRYAQASLEMLHRGDWIVPWFNDKVRFDKPILFYWLQMASYCLFGITGWAARLPCVLMLGLSVFATAWVVRKELGDLPAIFTTLVHLTMLIMLVLGSMSMTDMTLATWMWLTTLFLWQAYTETQSLSKEPLSLLERSLKVWQPWGLALGCAVLGVMTKGPVALALPGLAALGWGVLLPTLVMKVTSSSTWRDAWRVGWSDTRGFFKPWALQLLVFGVCVLVLSSPWFLLAAQKTGPLFWEKLFFHNIVRFKSVVSSHASPWWFYIPVALIGLFPWVPIAFATLTHLLQALRGASTPPVTSGVVQQSEEALRRIPPMVWMALGWFMLVFLFFTAAKTKLLTYLLPGMAAWSVVIGWMLSEWTHYQVPPRWLVRFQAFQDTWGIPLLLVVLWAASFWVGHADASLPSEVNTLFNQVLVPPYPLALLLQWCIPPVLVIWVTLHHVTNYKTFVMQAIGSGVRLMIIVALGYRFVLLPHLVAVNQADFDTILAYMASRPKASLVSLDTLKPALLFYHQHPVKEFQMEALPQLVAYAQARKVIWVVLKRRHPHLVALLKAQNALDVQQVYEGRKFMLVQCAARHLVASKLNKG